MDIPLPDIVDELPLHFYRRCYPLTLSSVRFYAEPLRNPDESTTQAGACLGLSHVAHASVFHKSLPELVKGQVLLLTSMQAAWADAERQAPEPEPDFCQQTVAAAQVVVPEPTAAVLVVPDFSLHFQIFLDFLPFYSAYIQVDPAIPTLLLR